MAGNNHNLQGTKYSVEHARQASKQQADEGRVFYLEAQCEGGPRVQKVVRKNWVSGPDQGLHHQMDWKR